MALTLCDFCKVQTIVTACIRAFDRAFARQMRTPEWSVRDSFGPCRTHVEVVEYTHKKSPMAVAAARSDTDSSVHPLSNFICSVDEALCSHHAAGKPTHIVCP